MGPVGLAHLKRAEAELLHANPAAKHVLGLGVAPRRLLAAVALELKKNESDVVGVRKIARRYEKLCSMAEAAEAVESPEAIQSDVGFLVQKLKTLALPQDSKAEGDNEADQRYLTVGLDASDLSTALLEVEQDDTIRALLQEAQSSVY